VGISRDFPNFLDTPYYLRNGSIDVCGHSTFGNVPPPVMLGLANLHRVHFLCPIVAICTV